MIKLPKQFFEEFELLKKWRVIDINEHDSNFIHKAIDTLKEYNLNENNKFILLYGHEIISNPKFFDKVYKFIDDYNLDAKISMATPSSFPRSAHPYTNLLMWVDLKNRENISWKAKETLMFDPNEFYYGKKITDESKNLKGILSIRKQNKVRDYIFRKQPKLDNGIVRYASWPNANEETLEDRLNSKNFPNIRDLQKEYSSSYFSFIIESDCLEGYYPNLTEKTIQGFLSGTMPIVLGSRNFIKDIELMGLKVWNKEFGFGEADSYSNYSTNRFNSFLKCIENVNKMNMNEVKKYWNENLHHIQQNYDLLSYILFETKLN